MPKDSFIPKSAAESRRSFLAKLGLGIAALAVVSVPLVRLSRGRGKGTTKVSQAFPGEDSIFHPASDPRRNRPD